MVTEDDPLAAFEGRLGSRLWTISAADGKTIAEHELAETPIFDGMIAFGGRIYMCTQRGEILCLGSS